MALKSMELTPAEKKDASLEMAPDSWQPRYAGGLCLWLDDEALKRLELKEPMKVGTIVNLVAKARVVGSGVDEHERKDGVHVDKRMSVQITDLDIEADKGKAVDTDKLYSTMKD